MIEPILSSSLALLHWLFLTHFEQDRPSFSSLTTEQSTKYYEESTSNLWSIGVWEIILSSIIFPSKPTDLQRNKLDIFNSCFNFNILSPVLMTASQLQLWLQRLNSGSIIYNHFFFLWLTAQGFLSSQAVNKASKLKTINIFVNSFVRPFNITRGNRTL